MKTLSLYDEQGLAHQLESQRKHCWDLETSIDWNTAIDLQKPLVPLDEDALFFPGASSEERLAVSQLLGLIIATAICEMEECLVRLRSAAFDNILKRYPVSPEFAELGEQFFVEEIKHSQAFRRYLKLFANQTGIELNDLEQVLPKIMNTKTERLLKSNLESGGYAFWWIVAEVEQEFLLLYNSISPFKVDVEPLYFDLHRKHFEEEARHASYPYMILELLITRGKGPKDFFHAKSDLILSQLAQTFWTASSLQRVKQLERIAHKHPLYATLARMNNVLNEQPKLRTFWKFFTSAPYISSLVNPQHHKKFLRFAEKMKTPTMPFPNPHPAKLVDY